MDIYIPLVDDMGVDAVFRKKNGEFVEIQIKARSKKVKLGDGALFAAMRHELRKNYWFVFYSERMDKLWIMTSKEFISESVQNKSGKNKGLRSIWFNGYKKNKETGQKEEYVRPQFLKYVEKDFNRIINS